MVYRMHADRNICAGRLPRRTPASNGGACHFPPAVHPVAPQCPSLAKSELHADVRHKQGVIDKVRLEPHVERFGRSGNRDGELDRITKTITLSTVSRTITVSAGWPSVAPTGGASSFSIPTGANSHSTTEVLRSSGKNVHACIAMPVRPLNSSTAVCGNPRQHRYGSPIQGYCEGYATLPPDRAYPIPRQERLSPPNPPPKRRL